MKIELLHPFDNDWDYGYLIKNREKRQILCLYKCNGGTEKRKTIAYARYLVSVREGRYLKDTEYVDHIDEDKTNDSIENLQILTDLENKQKHAAFIAAHREHGTYAMYHTGKCRCIECRKAGNEVRKRWYDKHRDEILQRRREKRKLKNKTTK